MKRKGQEEDFYCHHQDEVDLPPVQALKINSKCLIGVDQVKFEPYIKWEYSGYRTNKL